MAINFAFENMKTTITASSICADDGEVCNLISGKSSAREMGFSSETFIRPPVTLTISLMHPIELYRIDILPFKRSQCAKIIKVYIDCEAKKLPVDQLESKESHFNGFKKVSTAFINQPQNISLLNRSYTALKGKQMPNNFAENEIQMFGNLRKVSEIKIQICAMLTGSVPTIKELYIWGKPSHYCNENQKNTILHLSESCVVTKVEGDSFYGGKTKNISNTSKININNNETKNLQNSTRKKDVPVEFIDPLTLEIMVNPVILPSGNTVDQRTLDKHICHQEQMGNLPSDPFTGVLLNHKQAPNFDYVLKQRISRYQANVLDHHNVSQKRTFSDIISVEQSKPKETSCGTTKTKYRKITIDNNSRAFFCSKCDIYLTSKIVFYKLPCTHMQCAICVKSTDHCGRCLVKFKSSEIQRHHL